MDFGAVGVTTLFVIHAVESLVCGSQILDGTNWVPLPAPGCCGTQRAGCARIPELFEGREMPMLISFLNSTFQSLEASFLDHTGGLESRVSFKPTLCVT